MGIAELQRVFAPPMRTAMKRDCCDSGSLARTTVTRRRLLQIGGLGLLGLNLPQFLAATQTPAARRPRAKSVIFLHQFGGPSHHDSFDMKPEAPAEIRGEYRPIATSASGISICDRLPHMAPVMNKVTLVRTVHHEMRNHNSA